MNDQYDGEDEREGVANGDLFSVSGDTPETDQLLECDQHKVDEDGAEYSAYRRMAEHAQAMERQRDDAIAEATNAVNDIISVRWWRDRYKTALEGIAGFPIQLFDDATPLQMRDLAEHALEGDSSENA